MFIESHVLSELAMEASKEVSFQLYPESASYELRKAIGEHNNCSPKEVYVGNGADGVLADLFHLLRDKYDEMGLQPLTYQVYPYLCKRYKYQQKLLNETNQLWVIDSPNSITGEVFDFLNMKRSADCLIWDNVYGEYDLDNKTYILNHPNLVKINSFSKFYALASLRVGYCVAHADLISKLLQRKDIFNVNGVAQKMALVVLRNKEYFSSLVPKMLISKAKLTEGLKQMGFLITEGKSNFIWVTHSQISMRVLQSELSKASILVRSFEPLQMENYIRITVPPLSVVDHLLSVIKSVMTCGHNIWTKL
ncbi:MAG: histidinol-phosphate aminotransferase family protein [Chlamydiales bacterium]|nr:histidinol-phosphate aminotransferase family protein [Chlamydiales bacterium]